jgi:hypothetical protein
MTARKVHFRSQCAVRYIEPINEFECGVVETVWYQPHDFKAFKKERKSLVKRIRTIGMEQAKNNFSLQGIEHLLTLEAKDTYKSRIYDARFVVIQEQMRAGQYGNGFTADAEAEVIARRYQTISESSHCEAHERAVRTANELNNICDTNELNNICDTNELNNICDTNELNNICDVEVKTMQRSASESDRMMISKADRWEEAEKNTVQHNMKSPIRQ